MKLNRIFLVSLILLAIFTLNAISAADNVSDDSLAIDDSISESLTVKNDEILKSGADDSVLAAKKDSEMNVDFVTQDYDNAIYTIDETNDIQADNYNHDYLRVKFPNKVNGSLSFFIDDTLMKNRQITGKTHYFYANSEDYNLTPGTHSWKMKYSGDTNYASKSLKGTFNLNLKNDSNIAISFVKEDDNGNISVIDSSKDIFVNDHDSDYIMVKFPNKTQGTLSLYIDGKFRCDKEITAKTHYLFVNTRSYNLTEGNHVWKLRYTGDDKYKAEVLNGTFTLNPPSKTFVKKDPKMQVYVVGVGFSDSIDDETEVDPTGTYLKVKFPKEVSGVLYLFVDKDLKQTKKISAKTHYMYINASKYSLTEGEHRWYISYYGDKEYKSASASGDFDVEFNNEKVKVKKATPKIVSKNKSFRTKLYTKQYTVYLKTNKGVAIKKANVILTIKGGKYKKTIKTKTNNKGKIVFKIKGLTKKGTYKATIKYGGNKKYKAITQKITIKNTKTKSKFTVGKTSVSNKVEYIIIKKEKQLYTGPLDSSEAYDLLNKFRTEKGVWQLKPNNVDKTFFNTNPSNSLKPVERDSNLEKCAQIRAKELKELFDHMRPNGQDCYSAYPGTYEGYYLNQECIGMGQHSCKDIIEAWKETKNPYIEQGHRRAMLDPSNECVGIAGYMINGTPYWAMMSAIRV